MTPEEHYIEAERLLSVAEGCDWQSLDSHDSAFASLCIRAAKAHALLAAAPLGASRTGSTS